MSANWLLPKAKKDIGMDDDSYRANLLDITGKTSSRDLTGKEVDAVLSVFEKHFNWQRPVNKNEAQIKRITYLWMRLKEADQLQNPHGLTSFINKFTGNKTKYKASSKQLSNCIEALQSWCARENVSFNKGQR
jgi:hypothetical protein